MADREKVVKGLEVCTTRPCYCKDCPYVKGCALDSQQVMEDALALLKEQEPMKPKEGFQEDGLYYASCGDCGYPITELRYLKDSFCPHCGRKVLWD